MKRLLYWDSLKFVLIFLVVYAHVLSPYKSDSQLNMAVYNFVYLFHMPLFIFISGRFSQIRNKDTYQQRTLKLFETFVVFQFLGMVISLFEGKSLSIAHLIRPYWIFWYLLVLVYYRLVIYYTPQRWFRHRKTILASSFCISVAAGYLPIGYDWGIHRMLSFLPFFVMGYYSADINLLERINKIPSFVAVGTLVLAFAFTAITMKDIHSFVLHCPYNDWDTTHLPLLTFLPAIRCMFIIYAVVLSIMVIRLVPTNNRLAEWGVHTLFIYTYHALALKLLFLLINRHYLPQNELTLAVYTIAIIGGLLFLTRYELLHLLLNPISTICGSIHKKEN